MLHRKNLLPTLHLAHPFTFSPSHSLVLLAVLALQKMRVLPEADCGSE
jgi:hypothetical protein